MINLCWVDDTDGLEAMIEIIHKSEDALDKRIPIKRYTEIKKIIYLDQYRKMRNQKEQNYNFVKCGAMAIFYV